jgi:K+-transporting ATPase KdpF subunit
MNFIHWASAVLAVLLFGYLLYALIRAETF